MVIYIEKITNKYKKLPLPVRASIWFVICNCTLKAVQIITTPIYTRILTTEQYGEYSVFMSWIELVAIFTSLDIYYSGYNVGMTKFDKDRDRYTASMHGLCLFITLLWTITYLFNKRFFCDLFGMKESQVTLLFIYMFIMPIYQFWSAKQRYDYKYKSLLFVTLLSSVLTIGIGVCVALITSEKGTGVIFVKIFVEGLIAIPLIFFSVKKAKNLYNKFYWRYALKYNIPLVPHYLSTMILNHSDRIMIMTLCGTSEAAIYSVAYSLAVLMTIIQSAVTNAFTPWLFRKLKDKEYKDIHKFTYGLILIMGLLNLILIAIAPELISIMAPVEYQDACLIVPPVAIGTFLTFIYGIFVNIELYYGCNKVTAIASFFAASLNIILNYYFIRNNGYIAAGYTTFVCYMFLAIFHYLGMRYISNVYINKQIINIYPIIKYTFFICLITILLMLLYRNSLLRYGLISILIILSLFNSKKIINMLMIIKKK